MHDSTPAPRKPRADALRNRERLLTAARESLAEFGDAATLDDVVKRSGLGVGTLYRHFPTREALIEAVYRDEHEKLAAAAETLLQSKPPLEALRAWLGMFVDVLATKRSMAGSLAAVFGANADVKTSVRALTAGSLQKLLSHAEANGDIRVDFDPADVLRALVGVAASNPEPGWRRGVERFVELLISGMTASR